MKLRELDEGDYFCLHDDRCRLLVRGEYDDYYGEFRVHEVCTKGLLLDSCGYYPYVDVIRVPSISFSMERKE